jgi:hypothetical protein
LVAVSVKAAWIFDSTVFRVLCEVSRNMAWAWILNDTAKRKENVSSHFKMDRRSTTRGEKKGGEGGERSSKKAKNIQQQVFAGGHPPNY